MRKGSYFLFYLLVVLVMGVSAFVCSAEAHVLVTDKNIGAVLHIEPEDDPIAGKASSFFFEFKDTTNKFQPKDCDCTFSITEHGNVIYSQPLYKNANKPSLTNASAFFTFPRKDLYDIKVVGKPNTPGEFSSFALTYPVPVERSALSGEQTPHTSPIAMSWYILGAGIVILVFFVSFMLYKDKKKNTAKQI